MLSTYARSSMTRYLLNRASQNQNSDLQEKYTWYDVDEFSLSKELQQKFIQCDMDEESEKFLENCFEKSGWVFTQFFHSVAQVFLGVFFSMTSINGYLNRGSMFVFSQEQFKTLMDLDDSCRDASLLDLGAGDGTVTQTMAKYFKTVFATESSPTMKTRLSEKGFIVSEIDQWQNAQYDVISMLNLLDRMEDPLKLLNDVRLSLKPGGTAIVAIVLPYDPYVEKGSRFVVPDGKMPVKGRRVEDQVNSIVDDVFTPAGFSVKKFTKLPYLCEGDLYHDYFVLYDYVFILKAKTL